MSRVTSIAKTEEKARLELQIAPAEFQDLSPFELMSLFEAVRTTREVILGLINQPRFGHTSKEVLYNDAGLLLERTLDFFDRCETEIAATARSTECTERNDVECKYRLLLQYDLCESLDALTIMAAQGASDYNEARRKERSA